MKELKGLLMTHNVKTPFIETLDINIITQSAVRLSDCLS